MATSNQMRALLSAGLAACNVLVAAAAQAQGVSFIARRDFDAGANPHSVAVGDFNGDGVPDLAVANAGSYPYYRMVPSLSCLARGAETVHFLYAEEKPHETLLNTVPAHDQPAAWCSCEGSRSGRWLYFD